MHPPYFIIVLTFHPFRSHQNSLGRVRVTSRGDCQTFSSDLKAYNLQTYDLLITSKQAINYYYHLRGRNRVAYLVNIQLKCDSHKTDTDVKRLLTGDTPLFERKYVNLSVGTFDPA